jgi:hypothetical protein
MKKILLGVLFLTACKTPALKETPVTHEPDPICLQPKELVTVAKESCGVHATFTPAVDQSVPGVVICVLDPSGPAMLCMTPKEAADRGSSIPRPEVRRDP